MRRAVRLAIAVAVSLGAESCAAQPQGDRAHGAPPAVASFDTMPPLARAPLNAPLRVTAGFGEYRTGHFHAGLDFSTGGAVGREVFAPLDGWIERIRASGAGYGRSVTLRGDDGRRIVFGHLDAFDEPAASFLEAAQDSSGQYDQDLAPPGEMRVRAGQRVAWSGASGVGPAHLHIEIRRGDLALNPLRFGLPLPATTFGTLARQQAPGDAGSPARPVLVRLTLEPLDDRSYVARSFAPLTLRLAAAPETVVIAGRVRAWVQAGVPRPGGGMLAAYAVGYAWEGKTVECRFDSVAWDEDMPASEWVYDGRARAAPGRPIGLWFTRGFKPLVFGATADSEAGEIHVGAGDPPRPLTLFASDASGNRTERTVALRGPRAKEAGPDTTRAGGRPAARPRVATPGGIELAPLPGRFVRVTCAAPGGVRGVRAGLAGQGVWRMATWSPRGWTTVLPVERDGVLDSVVVEGRASGGATWRSAEAVVPLVLAPERETATPASLEPFRWRLPVRGVFESAVAFARPGAPARPAAGLGPVGLEYEVGPVSLAVRKPAGVSLDLPPGADLRGIGLYFENGASGWRWITTRVDSAARRVEGATRGLGRFALFADRVPPRIVPRNVPRRAGRSAPYGRWALEARVVERGSGVDPRASGFTVDGRRVPSEFDLDLSTLRWRPRVAPGRGVHRYEVVATDRAGNVSRATGTFTMR